MKVLKHRLCKKLVDYLTHSPQILQVIKLTESQKSVCFDTLLAYQALWEGTLPKQQNKALPAFLYTTERYWLHVSDSSFSLFRLQINSELA